TPCALAAQQATREIPIVVVSGDPVATGLVKSLNHPGGNITGLSLMAAEMHGNVSNCSATCSHPRAAWPFCLTPRIHSGNRFRSKSSLRPKVRGLKLPHQ